MTDAQLEALAILVEQECTYTVGGKSRHGAINRIAAESLIAFGYARRLADNGMIDIEITDEGRRAYDAAMGR